MAINTPHTARGVFFVNFPEKFWFQIHGKCHPVDRMTSLESCEKLPQIK